MDHALQFDGVGKHYKGFALEQVSFDLPRGYIMGLIGPNGAGKTTLIKLVLNLVRRGSGSIRVLGLDNLEQEAEVKSRLGFVPDEPCFHEDVTLKNLKAATAPFYPGWDDRRFDELAGAFGLPMGKRFKKLSHGTKTKFALALALSHGAELVLLDEPTSGLDPVFRRELLGLLADLLQDEQVSVLFSTHITADLERIADYITFLKDGRVVFSNPRDEVLDTFGLVKGGRDVLDDGNRGLFEGIRLYEHGFEGLTSRIDDVRSRLGDRVAVERASLDDVMVLMDRRSSHAA
jgi:ABC-2 type transport system ATP-binding protein